MVKKGKSKTVKESSDMIESVEELYKEARWQYSYEFRRSDDISRNKQSLYLIVSFILTATLGSAFLFNSLVKIPLIYNWIYISGVCFVFIGLIYGLLASKSCMLSLPEVKNMLNHTKTERIKILKSFLRHYSNETKKIEAINDKNIEYNKIFRIFVAMGIILITVSVFLSLMQGLMFDKQFDNNLVKNNEVVKQVVNMTEQDSEQTNDGTLDNSANDSGEIEIPLRQSTKETLKSEDKGE